MKIVNKMAGIVTHYTWDLAYFRYEERDMMNLDKKKLHHINNPYKRKWFADPFILDDNGDTLLLLVEEFDYSINRGRIAKLVVDKKRDTIADCKILLDLPTHLSFPAIYRVDSSILVHPENSASGASYIYEYDKFSESLVNPVCVLNEPVTDAIIRKEGDKYVMTATCIPTPNGNILKCYESDNIMGPYVFVSEETFENNTARMAGSYILFNGKLIRPAQDCNGAYGKAVLFYDGHNEFSRIEPKGVKYCGVHTFNTFQNTGIVDLKKWDYPVLIAIKNAIKKVII